MDYVDIRIEQFPVCVKKDVPVTINYSLVSNGTPPPVGARIVFGFYGNATFLHASTPPDGATLTVSSSARYTYAIITIVAPQSVGWNTQRTLTVLPTVTLDSSRLSQLCSIESYQPHSGYCSVFATSDTTAEAIDAGFEFKTKWLDIESQRWVYSYGIVLKATRHAVSNWKLSFADLPLGTKIHSELWAEVTHDGSEGVVELVTPGDDKYVLEPGKDLPISIQLRYPAAVGQKPELEELRYLVAYSR